MSDDIKKKLEKAKKDMEENPTKLNKWVVKQYEQKLKDANKNKK